MEVSNYPYNDLPHFLWVYEDIEASEVFDFDFPSEPSNYPFTLELYDSTTDALVESSTS